MCNRKVAREGLAAPSASGGFPLRGLSFISAFKLQPSDPLPTGACSVQVPRSGGPSTREPSRAPGRSCCRWVTYALGIIRGLKKQNKPKQNREKNPTKQKRKLTRKRSYFLSRTLGPSPGPLRERTLRAQRSPGSAEGPLPERRRSPSPAAPGLGRQTLLSPSSSEAFPRSSGGRGSPGHPSGP